ncbi:hypothetical protein E1301_Tti000034 [Triplophysa tibetana]|uniref:Uncharacterized protein n=1 Tax=Triplophysa tibetana TaxID=1572043 RepID=A0A5A9N4S0_9TELE|nr:hypothetical protein E1301_Tti000034 [Triplophysa tibetana]
MTTRDAKQYRDLGRVVTEERSDVCRLGRPLMLYLDKASALCANLPHLTINPEPKNTRNTMYQSEVMSIVPGVQQMPIIAARRHFCHPESSGSYS